MLKSGRSTDPERASGTLAAGVVLNFAVTAERCSAWTDECVRPYTITQNRESPEVMLD